MKNIKFVMLGVVIVLSTVILVGVISYNSRPPKVNYSVTTYEGAIDYILYELDLDFDLVTMGANCYTGVQKNEFKTEKYGILHTEFTYCKSSKTLIFRVYNDEKDQPLREPRKNELTVYDSTGLKTSFGV